MSNLTPFLALAIYPVAFLLGFSFNLIEFRWTYNLARRGRPINEPMPQEFQDSADAATRYLNFLVDALILASIAFLSHRISLDLASVGLRLADWKRHVMVGAAAGILIIVAQGLMLRRFPIDPRHAFTSRVRKGSPLLWVFIFISAAFSEELWIAFCLVVLGATAHSVAMSIAITILIFAAIHYSYRFWGAVAVAMKGIVSAILFLHFGSVIATFVYHLIANLGSLYWNRYSRR